ncbi:uncharacterized protein LOC135503236 [Lineus longissimus]|uniref:uncharacterized protein LOC135503236 n=1 Tax=Lineus longissimus TaxID=88925 RepID=UPI002B4DB09D
MIFANGILVLASCVLLVTGNASKERVELDEALEREVREISNGDEELAGALSEMKRGYLEAVDEVLDDHERALSLHQRDLLSDEELHEVARRSLEDVEENISKRALVFLATRAAVTKEKKKEGGNKTWIAFKKFFKQGAKIAGKALKKAALFLIKKGSKALSKTVKSKAKKWFDKGGKKKKLDKKTEAELAAVLA